MLNDIEQIQKVLSDKKFVLIALPPNADGDSLGSALALKIALEKQRKQVDIVCGDFVVPKNLKFLPQIESVKKTLTNLQKFIIKVDVSKNKIESLSYDIKDDWLSIYLTPKNGVVTKNDLRTAQTTFKYDVIITIGVGELDNLGEIFYNNTDLFYRVPVVNVDHRATNEHFGQINLVELTATSLSEIIHQIIQNIGPELLDGQIATALLTGMIIKTKSFKTTNVSPATLNLASQLINSGGDREKIIQQLYRTKSISTLKLWGAALTHLQYDARLGLVWTSITRDDFVRSGAGESDLDGIIDELLANSPEAKMILVL
ncbi:MAG: hypothetical protein A2261_02400, partial [Candidatus Magasanikbacteria bacterium RIFOXYA2_FULL_44_8]